MSKIKDPKITSQEIYEGIETEWSSRLISK